MNIRNNKISVKAKLYQILTWVLVVSIVLFTYQLVYLTGNEQSHFSLFTDLGKAFLNGHLYILTADPHLLTVSNPYDPELNSQYRHLDMSLYDGKYYIYFGPTNAVIYLIAKIFHLTGADDVIHDYQFNYIWSMGIAIITAIFLKFFTNVNNVRLLFANKQINYHLSLGFAIFSFLLVSSNAGIMMCLSLGRFYEAAVSGGLFFFWLALTFLLYALSSVNSEKPRQNKCTYLFFGSGMALMASYFSAYNHAIVILFIGIFIPIILWFYYKKNIVPISFKKILTWSLAFEIPVFLTAMISFVYNYKRFHSIFEFGYNYMTGCVNTRLNQKWFFNVSNLKPNFYKYILESPKIHHRYPFLSYRPHHLPKAFQSKQFYIYTYDTVGLLYDKFILYPIIFIAMYLFIQKIIVKKSPALLKNHLANQDYRVGRTLGFIFLAIFLSQLSPIMIHAACDEKYMAHFYTAYCIMLIFFASSIIYYCQKYYYNGLNLIFSSLFYLTGTVSILMMTYIALGLDNVIGLYAHSHSFQMFYFHHIPILTLKAN